MTNPYPNNPLFSSLVEAHKFARTTPALDVCVDQLSDIVEHHKYSGHPDDECNYEACMREELEIFLMTATHAQEEYEVLSSMMMELPEGHRSYMSIKSQFEELVARYGSKSK